MGKASKEKKYQEYLRQMLSAYMKSLQGNLGKLQKDVSLPNIPTNSNFLDWLKEQDHTLNLFGLRVDSNMTPPVIRPLIERDTETWILIHKNQWEVTT